MGNTSITKIKQGCYGILGGWRDPIEKCELVEVCKDKEPEALDGMSKGVYPEHTYYLGKVNYTCPVNMETEDGDSTQELTCFPKKSVTPLEGQPMSGEFTFLKVRDDDNSHALKTCSGILSSLTY